MINIPNQSFLALEDRIFNQFRKLIFDQSGINLQKEKKELLKMRLQKRIRTLGVRSFKDYYKIVINDKSGDELTVLLDSISTNVTSFFRETKHFHFLEKVFLPELIKKRGSRNPKEVRIWSAACSSGEEPYSIVLNLLENKKLDSSWKIKILATDISTRVLGRASKGFYPSDTVKSSVSKMMLRKYFSEGGAQYPDYHRVNDDIRKMILFKRFNLMTPQFPFKNKFDCIFCRNVMIYFDRPTRETLVNKYYDYLNDGGYLFIGHAESLNSLKHKFKYVQPTLYMK